MLMSKIYVGTLNEHHTIQKQITQTVSLTKTAIFIDESMRHLIVGKMKINKVSHFEKKKTVPIVLNDVLVHVEPDSGADLINDWILKPR